MAQPKPKPWSIRVKADLRERIAALAVERGITANAMAIRLWEDALGGVIHQKTSRPISADTSPKAVLAHAEAKAAHLGRPKPKRSWNLDGVQFGPTTRKAGSGLKAKR